MRTNCRNYLEEHTDIR